MAERYYLTKLAEITQEKGMLVRELSQKSTISIRNIYSLNQLTARALPYQIEALAKALGVTAEELGPVKEKPERQKREFVFWKFSPKCKLQPGGYLTNLPQILRKKRISTIDFCSILNEPWQKIEAIRQQNKKATPEEIDKIAKVLGITVDELGAVARHDKIKRKKRKQGPRFDVFGLDKILREKNLTNNDLDYLLGGWNAGRVAHIRNGRDRATLEEVQAIAEVLGVDLKDLQLVKMERGTAAYRAALSKLFRN